jgi:hypothetical protein
MAPIDDIKADIVKILTKYDRALKVEASIDGDNIEFEYSPNEIVEECWEDFYSLGNSILPKLLSRDIAVSDLPAIFTLWGIDNFGRMLVNFGDYKYLHAACMDLDPSNFSWDPFHSALRSYFSLEKIANIKNKFEFDLAVTSFTDSIETYSAVASMPMEDARAFAFIAQMTALKSSIYASYKTIQKLFSAINQIRPYEQANTFTQVSLPYVGSSFGLEPDIADWIHKQISTEFLFDEDLMFDVNDQLVNQNLELLKSAWLQKPVVELSEIEDHVWKIVAANLPAELSHDGQVVEFAVHCVYQLHERLIQKEGSNFEVSDNPIERYRVVLLRTGERPEYDSELDRCFLALQILVGANSLGTDVSNIESEIDWLRLKEKDNPLLGVGRKELEILESSYLARIKKIGGN